MALQCGGVEGVGVGHGVAVDGAGVDLGGVADTCGIQGLVELADGLLPHVVLGQAEVDLGGERGDEAVRAVGRVGDQEAGVESGDGGHLAGVGRCGAHCQGGAYAVADHGGRPGADLGLGGEEPEVSVGVAQDLFGGVRLDQGHQLGDDRGPYLFSDVLGKFGHRGRAVPVVDVGDEHVVPVPGQFAGHLPQYGPHAEGVGVDQHSRVPLAEVGEGGESVGLAVCGGNPQRLGGHEFSCRG